MFEKRKASPLNDDFERKNVSREIRIVISSVLSASINNATLVFLEYVRVVQYPIHHHLRFWTEWSETRCLAHEDLLFRRHVTTAVDEWVMKSANPGHSWTVFLFTSAIISHTSNEWMNMNQSNQSSPLWSEPSMDDDHRPLLFWCDPRNLPPSQFIHNGMR